MGGQRSGRKKAKRFEKVRSEGTREMIKLKEAKREVDLEKERVERLKRERVIDGR